MLSQSLPDPTPRESILKKSGNARRTLSESSNGQSKRPSVHYHDRIETLDATGLHHVGSNRQDTFDSQRSQESQRSAESTGSGLSSQSSQPYDSETVSAIDRPVSTISLPEFRKQTPTFYWPRGTGQGDKVHKYRVEEDPDQAFREYSISVGHTPFSDISSVVLLKKDGKQEHFALKRVPCEHRPREEGFRKLKKEFKLLAKIKHNHIIATVGSFVEGSPKCLYYGLLLFPLAFRNLKELLNEVSDHNTRRFDPAAVWISHEQSGKLLDYTACLCRAVLYLNGQNIKHRDIKCENILIDKDGNVVLADFDIAKQYTHRTMASTSSYGRFTAETAPETVKEGLPRSFDWDIFSLGCVFLEMTSMAFGETSLRYKLHFAELPEDGELPKPFWVDYSEAQKSGKTDSWIAKLKAQVRTSPQKLITERFECSPNPHADSTARNIEAFFDMILTMLKANIKDDHAAILRSVWKGFSRYSGSDCPHCHPEKTSYGNPPITADGPSGLSVPGGRAQGHPPLTKIDSMSEGSSDGSSKDRSRSYTKSSTCDSSERNGDRSTSSHTDGLEAISSLSSNQYTISDQVHSGADQADVTDDTDPDIKNSRLAAKIGPTLHRGRHNTSVPTLEISRSSSQASEKNLPLFVSPNPRRSRRHTEPQIPRLGRDEDVTAVSSISSYLDRENQPGVEGAAADRGSPGADSSSQDRDDSQTMIDGLSMLARSEDTTDSVMHNGAQIEPNTVRVLTFSPPERIGVSSRKPSAIEKSRLLFYRYKEGFNIEKPVKVDQAFLNGVFFDIPPMCNTTFRLPRTRGKATGELSGGTVTLSEVLTWTQRFSCWVGWPRIRLMYVPGDFTDEALRECLSQ